MWNWQQHDSHYFAVAWMVFVLFFYKICSVAIYAVLSRNLFLAIYALSMWRKIKSKNVCYTCVSVCHECKMAINGKIWPKWLFMATTKKSSFWSQKWQWVQCCLVPAIRPSSIPSCSGVNPALFSTLLMRWHFPWKETENNCVFFLLWWSYIISITQITKSILWIFGSEDVGMLWQCQIYIWK